MPLTAPQLTTLKAAILGDPTMAAFWPDAPGRIVEYGNAVPASGATSIYRSNVLIDELKNVIAWGEFLSATQAQRDTFMAMTQGSTVDATQLSVRTGFGLVFSTPSSPTLAAMNATSQRLATRFEALFTTASVSAVFNQVLTESDVRKAMTS